jgi:N-acetylneuraminate lyase
MMAALETSLPGLYPAFLTPLTSDGKVSEPAVEQLIEHLLQAGMDGTYVGGSTGEGLLMDLQQREILVDRLARSMPDTKRLIVHVGAADVKDASRLAQHAAKAGAKAVSSLPPKGDPATVEAFYAELAAQSPLPLVLYYFPKVAPGAFADADNLLRVCELPNVVGVKFTDFDLFLLERVRQAGKIVFNGYDEVLVAGLLMGANGGIGSTYNVMPKRYVALYEAAKCGNWDQAREEQREVNAVIRAMIRHPWLPAMKAVMAAQGFACGPVMNGQALTEEQRRNLFDAMDAAWPEWRQCG